MNTYLGAAQDLSPADIDPAEIAAAKIVYLEGYLWDPPGAKEAFLKASKIAHEAGRKVALTLSDSFCVGRYRDEFLGLMRNGTADIVFANESELHSLYETSDFDTALKQLRNDVKLGVVTRSEKGCVVVTPTDAFRAPASPITQLVDTTGAGDLFAAGFLYGLSRDLSHKQCGELGALAAAEVIQHIGARPQVSLKELAAAARADGLRLRSLPRHCEASEAIQNASAKARTGSLRDDPRNDSATSRRLRRLQSQPLLHRVAHHEFLDLSGHGHRKFVDELDVARDLVVGDLAIAEGAHLFRRQRLAGPTRIQAQSSSP